MDLPVKFKTQLTYVVAECGVTKMELRLQQPLRSEWPIGQFDAGWDIACQALGRTLGRGADSGVTQFALETSVDGRAVRYQASGLAEGTSNVVLSEMVRLLRGRTGQVLRGKPPQRFDEPGGYSIWNGRIYEEVMGRSDSTLQLRMVVPIGTTGDQLVEFGRAVRAAAGATLRQRQREFGVHVNLPQGWARASGSFHRLSAADVFAGLGQFLGRVRTDHLG